MATYNPHAPIVELLDLLHNQSDLSLVKELKVLIENRFINMENLLKSSERSRADLETKVEKLTPQKVEDVLTAYDFSQLSGSDAQTLIKELKKICPSVSPVEKAIIDADLDKLSPEECLALLKNLQKRK